MKFSIILITCIGFGLFLYGQDSLSIFNADKSQSENIYYSSYWGAYSVNPILTKEKSHKYELKINNLSEKLDIHNIYLNNLLQLDTVSVPKVYSFLGGLYTKPMLTAEQKKAKNIKEQIKKLKYEIKNFDTKRTALLNRYYKIMAKDSQYVQIKLLWGFASWEEKKSTVQFDNKN